MIISRRDANKEKRRLKMIEAAAEIYSCRGIDSTTMQEVADRAGLGVASLYRYFPGKIDIAVAAAIYMWKKVLLPLGENMDRDKSAWDNIRAYMNGFINLIKSNPDFFRFMENFDNYISRQPERPEAFKEYDKMLTGQDSLIIEILEAGQKNLSIRSDIDIAHYYSITTKSIMAFTQKLLLRGSIIQSDIRDPEIDLKILINVLLDNIKIQKPY